MRKGGPFARHNPTEAAIHAINEVAASWPEVHNFWRRLVKANPILAGVDLKAIERGIAAAMTLP